MRSRSRSRTRCLTQVGSHLTQRGDSTHETRETKTIGIHPDRAPGGDRDHRGPDRPAAARRAAESRGGPAGPVCQPPQAVRPGDPQLRAGATDPALEPPGPPARHLVRRDPPLHGAGNLYNSWNLTNTYYLQQTDREDHGRGGLQLPDEARPDAEHAVRDLEHRPPRHPAVSGGPGRLCRQRRAVRRRHRG